MKHITKLCFLFIAMVLLLECTLAREYQPKRIKILGEYCHNKTNIAFPQSFDDFKRKSITSFNKDSTNIGVSYYCNNSMQDPYITIYIYPAPIAMEDRIRSEYFNCLQVITNIANQGIDAVQKPIKISKGGYKLLGLRATISEKNLKTVLVLFECGKYFIKYRVSSNISDTTVLNEISTKLIDRFSPVDIVKKQPLIIGATIHIAPGVVRDTSSLKAISVAAGTKAKWVYENVDSLERCSGFPSLYFEEQKETISKMLLKWETLKSKNERLEKYFNDLILIRNSGFLNEFIYDEYRAILLLPDSLKLDYDNYFIWKNKNKPTVTLLGPYSYYLIGYEESYKTKEQN